MQNQPSPSRTIYSVTQLNAEVRLLLEDNFPLIWIEGELSNLARPASGHWYFTLKDDQAQVRCAMFRNRNQFLRFKPESGDQVLMRAKISLYEGRGDFQLIVDHMEAAGEGLLQRQFEQLKKKLDQQGMFSLAEKLPIPELPTRIGLITSKTGAAVHDVLTILERRFPALPITLYPVPVQGEKAAPAICKAIEIAQQRADCDVLLLVRGGGSLEDLWAFNMESVANAMFTCTLPIVTGIGHEVDVTIADLVADQRAATPSAAAEMVSPQWQSWFEQFHRLVQRLGTKVSSQVSHLQLQLESLRHRLRVQEPYHRINQYSQRLDELNQRLLSSQHQKCKNLEQRLQSLILMLQNNTPSHHIRNQKILLGNLRNNLEMNMQHSLTDAKHRLRLAANGLDTVSPLATLQRGYTITKKVSSGEIIRNANQVKLGEEIETQLSKGRLTCVVQKRMLK